MSQPCTPGAGPKSALAIFGLAAIAVLCCATPALIAVGALTAVGGFLGNPWIIAAGVALLAGLLAAVIRRRMGTKSNCCAPGVDDRNDRRPDSTPGR